ncbi:MAG: rhomboid family intramembrane serine protease [Myxococcales bacterium]|nr:rhomboid family intramembrane serine protease [Myxococcales bacterium]
MALGGFNCPYCRNYNANGDKTCARCKRYLPPRWVAQLLRNSPLGPNPVTTLLIGVCVLVFFAQLVDANNVGGLSFGLGGMPMSTLLRFGALTNNVADQPWTVASYMFSHMGYLHIIFNLMGLWDLGRRCEAEAGAGVVLTTFLATGIAGGVASVAWYGNQPYISSGASGAVFGLAGFMLGVAIRTKDPQWKDVLIRTMLYSFIMYFALHTNQAAHLGGLALGAALGYSRWLVKSSRNAPIAWMTAGTGLLLLSLATLVPSQLAAGWRTQRDLEHARRDGTAPDFNYPQPSTSDFEFVALDERLEFEPCIPRPELVGDHAAGAALPETPAMRALFWARLAGLANFTTTEGPLLWHKPSGALLQVRSDNYQTVYHCGGRYDPGRSPSLVRETAAEIASREAKVEALVARGRKQSMQLEPDDYQAYVEAMYPPGVWQAVQSLEALLVTLPARDLGFTHFDLTTKDVWCGGARQGVSFSAPCPFAEGLAYLLKRADTEPDLRQHVLNYVSARPGGDISAEQAAALAALQAQLP